MANNKKSSSQKMNDKSINATKESTTTQTVAKSRGMSGTTFAIIALSLLLIASVILGLTGAFFTANTSVEGTITLGDPVSITVTQGGATAETLTFSGAAMPGTVYDQVIGIQQPASTSDAVVRAKLTLTNTDGATVNVEAVTSGEWLKGDDDYYYYQGIVQAGESHEFVTSITVPKSLTNTDANKTYAISIVVEAIQHANGAASEVWTTAPEEWITNYGSGSIA